MQIMACVVVFCTTYALILPAITMEQQYICGKEEHTHSAECYTGSGSTQTVCTQNVHAHVSECYGEDGVLCCGFADVLLHSHDAFCADAQGNLICAIAEAAEHIHGEGCYTSTGHSHESACYETRRGELICELPEDESHAHTDGCFVMLTDVVCGQEEAPIQQVLSCGKAQIQAHVHESACLDAAGQYSCGKPEVHSHQHTQACIFTDLQLICEKEEHVHDELCKVDLNADVETAENWEKTMEAAELTGQWAEDLTAIAATQLGYEESERNFLSEDDVRKGYTRYGAWYGTPYGDWDAMFVSFCLHYAGISEEAISYDHNAEAWAEKLQEAELLNAPEGYTPVPGDLVFFEDELETVTHMGIVADLEYENDPATGAEVLTQIRTIEGDVENKVMERRVEIGDSAIYGYVSLAAVREDYEQRLAAAAAETNAETTEAAEETTASTEETTVETTGEAVQMLTQTAQTENYLVTVSYSAELQLPEGTELRVVEYAKDSDIFRQRCAEAGYELDWLLNIGFFLGEEELDLAGAFDVVVTSKQGQALGSDITHFAESGAERIDGAEEGAAVAFSADSFSDFGGGDSSVATISNEAVAADATATTLYFTTVAPDKLEVGKNYAIYCVPDSNNPNTYVFLTSLEQCPALTVTDTGDNTNPVTVGGMWKLTANSTLDGLSWQLELPTDESATYKRLFSAGYNPLNSDGSEKYPGPEYLCFNKPDLQTWYNAGDINLKITATNVGAGANILAADGTNYGRTKIYYDSTNTDASASWQAVAASGSATTVYFAEVSTECPHSYTYTATAPTCNMTGSVTYNCSICGESSMVTLDTTSVLNYANSLRTSNIKEDYSTGQFTWDTESKTWSWTYYNGVMMDAFMRVGTDEMFDYVVDFYDDVLDETGNPKDGQYRSGEVDSVPPALALFDLLGTNDETQNQRYVTAIQYVFDQLWNKQTVLGEAYGGNFLHKSSWTTYQFGLDGIYMALPFLMEYANALDDGLLTNSSVTSTQIYDTINSRLNWVAENMYDGETGTNTQLYHHGWNGSNGNGVFWGRGIGWYAVALVDIIDMMPDSYRTQLTANLTKLFEGMLKWQDTESGMWYNVVNKDGTLFYTKTNDDGTTTTTYNELETSVSSMMAYAMMKAYREGWVDAKYYEAGLRALNGIMENKVNSSGAIEDTYKSSSVFTSETEYLKNGYTTNEAKGVGALIMAAAPDHEWGPWTVSTDQAVATAAETTTTQATETRTCTVCETTQTRTVTVAEEEKTLIGYKFTVVDPTPTKLLDGETYAVYAPSGDENYVFLLSSSSKPGADRVVTTNWEVDGYDTAPMMIGGTWYVPASELSEDVNDFTWKAVVETLPETGSNGSEISGDLLLQAQGSYSTTPGDQYLSIRDASDRNVQTYGIEGDNGRPQYVLLTVDDYAETTDYNADCTIVNKNASNYHLILSTASGDDWKTSSDNDNTTTDKGTFTATPATPVVFAKVTPVYEEAPDTTDRYQFTTVNPSQLTENTKYVIYTKTGDDDYTFLYADENVVGGNNYPTAQTVSDTGFIVNPVTVGKTWSLAENQMPKTFDDFTWQVEDKGNDILWLALQGYDSAAFDGPEYLCMRSEDSAVQTWYNGGTGEGINLNIANVNGAACNILRADDGKQYKLYYNSTANQWEVQAADGTATTVYFAAVTDTQAQEEEVVYDLKVLGTDGPVEGKKYVIYFPYEGTATDGTAINNVHFLGSTVNPGKGNYRRGANDMEETLENLKQAGFTWDLESTKIGDDWTVTDIQWTVVKEGDDWCLQSVADPNLHLKLVCTSTSGASQVNSTAYDEQGTQYFSLQFNNDGATENDSWYTITTEDGMHGLYLNTQNVWQAITSDLTEEDGVTPIDATPIYFAEVVDDSAEGDTGTGDTAMEEEVVGYEFTTLNPNDLENGDIVSIYLQNEVNGDDYTFLSSRSGLPPIFANDTGEAEDPVTIDGEWEVSVEDLGTRGMANFTWEVVIDDNNNILLKSLSESTYLTIYRSSSNLNGSQTDNNMLTVETSSNTAAAQLRPTIKNYYLCFDEDGKIWTGGTAATTIYFAGVTEKTELVPAPDNFPEAVETGDPSVDTLRFYNFVESGGEHIAALPGCKFVITGTTNGYTYTIISGENPELHLPSDIPDGTYTITEVSAADGYLRDVEPERTFTISNGQFVNETTIGTFLNHAEALVNADKVAEVEDYNNRTYQIMLSAESDLRLYQMNPVDVLFVVDQSNSMLFPAGLTSTEQEVTIYKNEGYTYADAKKNESENSSSKQLDALAAAGTLSKEKTYYIIADAEITSTVYALWHNGVDWMYQDASYYAKAYHENKTGYQQDDEYAVFPDVAAYTEQSGTHVITVDGVEKEVPTKANGGSLSYQIGGSIKSDIEAAGVDSLAYTIYTATNEYNRLHYLQDSLAHAIHQLADANDDSTVSLIRFNRETLHEQCIGPWKLSPTNVQKLVNEVENIQTDGGTRQDIALEHTYDHLMGNVTWYDENEVPHTEDAYTKGSAYTFTVLITDGAPVASGGDILNLGAADNAIPTDTQIQGIVKDSVTTGEGDAAVTESAADYNESNGVTVYSSIKYWGDKVGINNFTTTENGAAGESILMTIGLGMGAVKGGSAVLEEIATEPTDIYHDILEDAEDLMDRLKQLLFASMVPREKVDLMADVTDVISDSFYPIAYTTKGNGADTGRSVLYSDDNYDWIILEPGDWITIEGEYVGPTQGTTGAGRLTVDTEGDTAGDFRITWDDQILYDCELVWVPLEEGKKVDECLPAGKTLVTVDDKGRIWFSLAVGDEVYAHGEYVDPNNKKTGIVGYSFLQNPNREYEVAGKYVQGTDRAHIQWYGNYYSIDFDANFQPYNWHGKFYVKAKEDFIGGNAIDTNKTAQVIAEENDGDAESEVIGTVSLETPTVNVRLLDMNQNNSEVTVFLGDMINSGVEGDPLASPLDSLKDFFDKTVFTKLIADFDGKGTVMNKIDPNLTDEEGNLIPDGLETDVFYLKYAMGRDLTVGEWDTLKAGGTVTVEYTYDNASSHGPVGYFTFELTKEGKPLNDKITDTSDYDAHEAKVACPDNDHTLDENGKCKCQSPVETYTLHVKYTAYKLGETYEDDTLIRPEATVHNDTADIDGDGKTAGTEVSDEVTSKKLEDGYGIVDKDNVHKVHVISGAIEVTKKITDALKSETDQDFTFVLSRAEDVLLDEDGNVVLDDEGKPVHDESKDKTLTVTVEAGQSTGTATIDGLKRGTWLLSENETTTYHVKSLTVDTTRTNCHHTTNADPDKEKVATTATFYIGWDKDLDSIGEMVNVIGYATTETTDQSQTGTTTRPDYTSYVGYPNGVLGVVSEVLNDETTYSGKVPVEKVWEGENPEDHAESIVYVVMYKDGQLIKDENNARMLKLDSENGWEGEFIVPLADDQDKVTDHTYEVREVYGVVEKATEDAVNAGILYDGNPDTEDQVLYYESEAAGGSIIQIGDFDYLVEYGTAEDGTLTVTNHRARVLPESGGMGTEVYTFSGWLLMAAALMYYGYIRRRKREGRAVE